MISGHFLKPKKEKKIEKKKQNEKIIKDKIIRDIRAPFEQEGDYYDPKRVSNFGIIVISSMKVMVIKNGDEYLHKIKPYLRSVIINLQNSDAWKTQVTIAINFISSKDVEEERVMHSNSGNIKFTPYSDANDVIDKLFKSLYQRKFRNITERKWFYF